MLSLFFAILFLVIGIAVGYVGYTILNDGKTSVTTIELVGDEVVTLSLNEKYNEQGAIFIIDGNDYQSDVVIEGNVDVSKTGTYVITYTLNNQIYNIVLQRIVNVGGDSNGN